MNLKVSDSTTRKLIKTYTDDSLETAFLKMKNHRIRHLPVYNHMDEVVGIISDRDICRGMNPDVRDYQSIRVDGVDFDPRAKVRDFMSWPVRTVSYDSDLKVVVGGMVREKLSAFLVTRGDDVVGIVTSEDLLKVLYELLGDRHVNDFLSKDKGSIGKLLGVVE